MIVGAEKSGNILFNEIQEVEGALKQIEFNGIFLGGHYFGSHYFGLVVDIFLKLRFVKFIKSSR